MGTGPKDRSLTRREFLGRTAFGAGVVSLLAVSGCQALAPLAPAAEPSATTDSRSAGQVAPASPPAGKLTVWFNASWNELTNQAVEQIFAEWGAKNNVDVECQVLSSGQHEKISAAIAAGRPPEIMQTDTAYWHKLGELVETTAIVSQMKTQGGGLYPVAEQAVTFEQARQWAVPWGINGWPIHARKDLWEQGGNRFPATWDEFGEVAARIQQPPRTYAFGFATGRESDATDNFINLSWSFGAQLADASGVPTFASAGTVEALKLVKSWFLDLKIIPPESISATLTSWNNEVYQKGRALAVINPSTIYGWLVVNDQELLNKTGLYALPAGPAGAFTGADVWQFSVFRGSRSPEKALEALAYFLEPDRYQRVMSAVQGRFVPVYRALTKTAFWTQNVEFREMIKVAETGRTNSYAGPPMAWYGQIVNAQTIPEMIRRVVQDGENPATAVATAQAEMVKSYNQLN